MLRNLVLAIASIVTVTAISVASAETATTGGVSTVVKGGTFVGKSRHETTGGVSILKTPSGYVAILEADFSLDDAPAPTLGFGKNGFDKSTEFAKLESKNGLQVYAIPSNINPNEFDEFYVWCADFSVPLGLAKIS